MPTRTTNLATAPQLVHCGEKTKKRPYLCTICPRSFCKKIRLKNHLIAHKKNSLLLCTKCGQYFGSQKLGQHQKNCVQTSDNTVSSSAVGEVRARPSQTRLIVHKRPLQPNSTKMLNFKCTHCSQKFRFKSIYLRHLVSHTGLQPYPCMHCGHRYPSKSTCLQHEAFCDGVNKEELSKEKRDAATILPSMPTLEKVSQVSRGVGETEYKCKFCTKTFVKPRSLRRHILTHNEVKPYRCKACDSCFSRYDHLKVHQNHCKGKSKFGSDPVARQQSFDCKECGRSFPSDSKLNRHNTMFHTVKLFKCPTVSQTQLSSSKSPPNGFSCAYCTSHFLLFSQLQEHFLNAHRPETVVEPVSSVPLQDHLSNIPNIKEEPVDDTYDDRFSDGANLTCKLTLDGESPKLFSCQECNMSFASKAGLVGHQRVHTSKPPFICKTCKRGFWNKFLLRNHYRKCRRKASEPKATEPEESPLKAKIDFALNDSVDTEVLQADLSSADDSAEEHLETPEENEVQNSSCEEKKTVQYQCSECEMSFTDGLLTCHDPNRPYACKLCNQRFWTRPSLCNHYGEEHPKDIFTCRFCKKIYTVKKSLSRHYKKWHLKEQKDLEYAVQEKSNPAKQSTQASTNDEDNKKKDNVNEDSDSDSA
uniref:C2H2-type domain-containing protein n=1 Tax=Sphaeramia orbicularis TaxID=375764 RepID=A0A673B2X9_9TELE